MTQEEIKQWIEDEAEKDYDKSDYASGVKRRGFKKGATAMHDLLSPQIEELKKENKTLDAEVIEYSKNLKYANEYFSKKLFDANKKIEEQHKEIEGLKNLIESAYVEGWRSMNKKSTLAEQIQQFKNRHLLNSEQEDKRSVATEDDSSNADGKKEIDFGKFLTLHGYELYGDGWALQKGKRCKTNEQVYEQFKAQLAEQKK